MPSNRLLDAEGYNGCNVVELRSCESNNGEAPPLPTTDSLRSVAAKAFSTRSSLVSSIHETRPGQASGWVGIGPSADALDLRRRCAVGLRHMNWSCLNWTVEA